MEGAEVAATNTGVRGVDHSPLAGQLRAVGVADGAPEGDRMPGGSVLVSLLTSW